MVIKLQLLNMNLEQSRLIVSLSVDNATQITTLSNGCNRSNELENTLLDLLNAIDNKQLAFDRLIIECTGMADPGPITQTFFSDKV